MGDGGRRDRRRLDAPPNRDGRSHLSSALRLTLGVALAAVLGVRAIAQDITLSCATELGLLLQTASSPEASMPLWISRHDNPPEYRRNPAVWTGPGIDLTGKAVWNSCASVFGTTAISPLHVVYANHPAGIYPAGTVIRFIDNSNQIIERRVLRSIPIGSTDIDLSTLDRPLPPSIHWFKVMPRRWFLQCRRSPDGSDGGLPCVVLDGNTQSVLVKDIQSFDRQCFYTRSPTSGDRHRFTREFYGGDSGSPMFLLLGGELVLDGIYHWAAGGPELSESIPELDTAMAGSGFRVTIADLTPFAPRPTPASALLQFGANRPGA
jgi:hypothetical protein